MKKFYLIDGYNVGFKLPEIAELIKAGRTDEAVQRITTRIQNFLRGKGEKAWIVFDGVKSSTTHPHSAAHIKVEFSRKPETADDYIRSFVRNHTKLQNCIVVSSDNEIRYTALDHGARALKSEEFVKLLKTGSQSPKQSQNSQKYNPQNIDLDYWMEQFRSDDDDEK